MKVVIDVECNSLVNPSHVWVIVCKEVDTGNVHVFRRVTEDEKEKEKFLAFARGVGTWIGHNLLGYDYPVLHRLVGLRIDNPWETCRDTLVLSKLFDYSREGGHSIEQYGTEFGLEKNDFSDFTKYSQQLEDRCVRDTEIGSRVWHSMAGRAEHKDWREAVRLEQRFQLVVNNLHDTGFAFDRAAAQRLLEVALQELGELDNEITKAFKPKTSFIREVNPRRTKYGTLNRNDFRWCKSGDLADFNGGPFSLFKWVPFNPASHKQLVAVLNEAGWKPTDKTATHIETEREYNRLRYRQSDEGSREKISELQDRLKSLAKTGFKINENNLNTLPKTAPSPARTLARRILLEARRRTLVEWLGLVQANDRIHGKFYGIGAWTHRMAHQQPNTANIPTAEKLYGKEMRSLWRAPPVNPEASTRKVLVGVDAEGIQLRIFAHYINDKEFTDALVKGKKADQTDPHSLNQRVLGNICRSRQTAKRFIYALLLGAGMEKLAQILEATVPQTQEALDRLMERYTGFASLKTQTIPKDARNGYFIGLDGRRVPVPGQTTGERRHLVMSGYLQNGEAIIMKKACCMWADKYKLVNFVHDEWVVEADEQDARRIGRELSESISRAGTELKLRCPLAGEYHVGRTWAEIH